MAHKMENILRSKTGMYHIGLNSSSICNGRSGKFRVVSVEIAKQSSGTSFCKKCFPCGLEYSIEKGEIKKDKIAVFISGAP